MTKPVKWLCTQRICPVWSESLLSAWSKLGSLTTHWAHSEDSDQTWWMPRMIWVFTGRTLILLVLSWGGSYYFSCTSLKWNVWLLIMIKLCNRSRSVNSLRYVSIYLNDSIKRYYHLNRSVQSTFTRRLQVSTDLYWCVNGNCDINDLVVTQVAPPISVIAAWLFVYNINNWQHLGVVWESPSHELVMTALIEEKQNKKKLKMK